MILDEQFIGAIPTRLNRLEKMQATWNEFQ